MQNIWLKLGLDWARSDTSDFMRGMTIGQAQAWKQIGRIEDWEYRYIFNVVNARMNRRISA